MPQNAPKAANPRTARARPGTVDETDTPPVSRIAIGPADQEQSGRTKSRMHDRAISMPSDDADEETTFGTSKTIYKTYRGGIAD